MPRRHHAYADGKARVVGLHGEHPSRPRIAGFPVL